LASNRPAVGSRRPHIPHLDAAIANERRHLVVKLRLMRMGKKKQPTYRIVATDSRSPRDGRFIEILGHYNPRTEPSELKVDNAKAVGWLRQGAQPSDTVRRLLQMSGAWAEFKGEAPPAAPATASDEKAAS
jgi:small subunit ribosomal protein S16